MSEVKPEAKTDARQDATRTLGLFGQGLTTEAVEEAVRTSESVRTARFLWHPWYVINNREIGGNRFGVRHATLARMELIPILAWPVPVLVPRTAPFAIGAPTAAGAIPAAGVGSQHTTKIQPAGESVRMLLEAYGQFGLVELQSLASDTDAEKSEAFLLYHGVMKTTPEGQEFAGAKLLMEDLPDWLKVEAPALLKQAVRSGVRVGDETFKLRPQAHERGVRMIEDMTRGVAAATSKALNESNGILPETKKQLIGAGARIEGNKAMLDNLDTFLAKQFPSFSFDTTVELASRANREVADTISASSAENSTFMRDLLKQNQELMRQNQQFMKLLVDKQPA